MVSDLRAAVAGGAGCRWFRRHVRRVAGRPSAGRRDRSAAGGGPGRPAGGAAAGRMPRIGGAAYRHAPVPGLRAGRGAAGRGPAGSPGPATAPGRTVVAGPGVACPKFAPHALQLLPDMDGSGVEFDVIPAQAEDFGLRQGACAPGRAPLLGSRRRQFARQSLSTPRQHPAGSRRQARHNRPFLRPRSAHGRRPPCRRTAPGPGPARRQGEHRGPISGD